MIAIKSRIARWIPGRLGGRARALRRQVPAVRDDRSHRRHPLQPIASDDVARAVGDAALAEAGQRYCRDGGTDKIGLDNLVRRFLKEINDPREVISDPKAPYFGAVLNDQSLTPREGAHTPQRLIATNG